MIPTVWDNTNTNTNTNNALKRQLVTVKTVNLFIDNSATKEQVKAKSSLV